MTGVRVLAALGLLGSLGVGCSGESPVVGRSQGDSLDGSGPASSSVTQHSDVLVPGWGAPENHSLCMPTQLPLDATGDANCVVIRVTYPEGPCECEAPAFVPAKPGQAVKAAEMLSSFCDEGSGDDCSNYCACEAVKATGDSLSQCLGDEEPSADAYGWCYVSDQRGNPDFLSGCLPTEHQRLRALGATHGDYRSVIACSGETRSVVQAPRAIGEPCLPDDELSPEFKGFGIAEVSVYTESASCESEVCLVNHFQGRVSCPYGQLEGDAGGEACRVPSSDVAVSVAVEPQLVGRQAAKSVTCSCRCAGPGDGPFCECPSGTECRHVLDDLGLGSDDWAGSYCIPQGTEYDPVNPPGAETCLAGTQTCGEAHPY